MQTPTHAMLTNCLALGVVNSYRYAAAMGELRRIGFKRSVFPKGVMFDASVHVHQREHLVVEEHWSGWGGHVSLIAHSEASGRIIDHLDSFLAEIKLFNSFREAADFASRSCRENKCKAELHRDGPRWVVKLEYAKPITEPHYKPSPDELRLEQEKADLRRRTREESQQREWIEHREQTDKQKHELTEKRENILELARSGALSYEQLNLVVDNRGLFSFSSEELTELAEILKSSRPRTPIACPSCRMVGDNCICGKA